MNTKHSTAPAPADTQPLPRTLTALRMEAVANGVLAGCIVAGAVAAAVYLELPAVALFGLTGAWFALRARWLWGDVQRMAEHLPPKPARIGPRWFVRLYWWIARKQVQRRARPKPWRGIAVDGIADAVKLSRQPNEMRTEKARAVVAGLTPSDLRKLADEALQLRTLDERSWRLNEYRRVLPSGQVLTRGMFRKAQVWFVDNNLAVKEPHYRITVSLNEVDETLAKLK